jgi:hypothetical protein
MRSTGLGPGAMFEPRGGRIASPRARPPVPANAFTGGRLNLAYPRKPTLPLPKSLLSGRYPPRRRNCHRMSARPPGWGVQVRSVRQKSRRTHHPVPLGASTEGSPAGPPGGSSPLNPQRPPPSGASKTPLGSVRDTRGAQRRGGDSNPRTRSTPVTRFPVAPVQPLRHLSVRRGKRSARWRRCVSHPGDSRSMQDAEAEPHHRARVTRDGHPPSPARSSRRHRAAAPPPDHRVRSP